MIYLFYAFIIGVTLGALSAYHTKLFVSALLSSLILGAIFLRPVILVGASASGSTGRINPLAVYVDGFMMLPSLLRWAILLIPVFFLLGRLVAWIYLNFIKDEEIETEEERRARVVKEHGWGAEKDREFSSKIRIRR